MNEDQLLEQIDTMFHAEQLDSALVKPNEQKPWQTLLVYLGQDEKKREVIVEITARKQELGDVLKKEPSGKDYFQIIFGTKFGFKSKESTAIDVGSFINFLNRTLELPGFEYDEVENEIFYRYVLMAASPIDKTLIIALTGAIGLYISLYPKLIEEVARGEKTFNQILEEILETSK